MKKFTSNYIITSALYDFVFAYAIYNAFFEFQGITIDRIAYLLAFWAFSAMVFEIPSGALADRFSHKKMILIAPLLKSLTFIIWALAGSSVLLYGLGFMIWALASTLRSGTTEAYLYEILKEQDHIKEYEAILGKVKFAKQIAIGMSMISGGIIAYFNMPMVFYLSVIPLWLSAFYAFKLPESKMIAQDHISYWGHMKNAKHALFHNKALQVLLIYALLISLFGDLEEFDQLYYKFLKLPIWSFGAIAFATSILSSLAMAKAYTLKNIKGVYVILPTLSLVLLLGVNVFSSYASILCLVLAYVVISPLYVLIDGKIQKSIEDQSRATVTSLNGLFVNMLGVLITPVFGLLSRHHSITIIYWLMAVMTLGLILFAQINRNHLNLKR